MASFTPPPSSQLQPFAVPAPEYQDPLESLARLRQNRLQNMQVQQAQLKMQSQRGLMAALAQAGNKPDELMKIATARGDILPDDLVALRNHMIKAETDLATLDEKTRAKVAAHADLYGAMVMPNGEPVPVDQLPAVNARAKAFGYFSTGKVTPLESYSDAEEAKAHINANLGLGAIAKRRKEAADIAQSEDAAAASRQQVATSLLAGQETGQKITKERREQMIAELRGLPEDPKRPGVPTLGAWNKFISKYDDMDLPAQPTAKDIAKIVKSTVPEAQIPKYEMEANMAAQGMTGTTQWDQYLFQNAKAIGKKPNELTPAEFNAIRAKYVEDNPLMQALMLQQKQLNVKQLQNTLDRTLTPDEIESFGKDFVDLNLSPDMQAVFRSRGDNAYPQILLAAKKEAAKRGIAFSPTAWETKYKTWQRTENEFATGKESDQIQSFGNLMNHAAFLYDAKNALYQNDIPALRRIAGALGVQAGGSAETTFDTIAGFVADEATKAFLGSAGGVEERAKRAANFDYRLGDKQVTDNLKALMHLADSQRIQLESKYEKGTFGKGERIGQLFSQDTLNARDKVMGKATGGGGGAIRLKTGDGQVRGPYTEAQAAAVEQRIKAAGGTVERVK